MGKGKPTHLKGRKLKIEQILIINLKSLESESEAVSIMCLWLVQVGSCVKWGREYLPHGVVVGIGGVLSPSLSLIILHCL